jgi:hypothetical protein
VWRAVALGPDRNGSVADGDHVVRSERSGVGRGTEGIGPIEASTVAIRNVRFTSTD